MGLLVSRGGSSSGSSGNKTSSTKKASNSGSSGGGLLRPREPASSGSSAGRPSSSSSSSSTKKPAASSGSTGAWNSSQGLLRPREPASSSGSSGGSGGKPTGSVTQVAGAYTGTGNASTGGVDIPRYTTSQKYGDNGGGKLGADGVLRYPEGVRVDPERYAKTQAALDYSYGASGKPRGGMDSAYYTEYKRLSNVKPGEGTYIDTGGKAPAGSGGTSGGGSSGGGSSGGTGGYPGIGGGEWAPGDTDIPKIDVEDLFNDYMKDYEAALKAAQEAEAKALAEKVNGAVGNINAQKDPLKAQYEESARQAYISKMQAQKTLPQQLSSQGLTGGVTESANLALEAGYGNSLNDLAGGYNNGLAQIDRDAASVKATGDISAAENLGKYQQQLANATIQNGQYAQDLQGQLLMQQLKAQQQAAYQQRQAEIQARYLQQQLAGQKDKSQTDAEREYQVWLKKFQAQQK